MTTDYALVLLRLFPNRNWELLGQDYDGLAWHDDSPKPTRAELDAAWPQVEHDLLREQVERARRAAYERDADPVFFRWQRGTATEQDWLDAVQAVKDAHPYPEPS